MGIEQAALAVMALVRRAEIETRRVRTAFCTAPKFILDCEFEAEFMRMARLVAGFPLRAVRAYGSHRHVER